MMLLRYFLVVTLARSSVYLVDHDDAVAGGAPPPSPEAAAPAQRLTAVYFVKMRKAGSTTLADFWRRYRASPAYARAGSPPFLGADQDFLTVNIACVLGGRGAAVAAAVAANRTPAVVRGCCDDQLRAPLAVHAAPPTMAIALAPRMPPFALAAAALDGGAAGGATAWARGARVAAEAEAEAAGDVVLAGAAALAAARRPRPAYVTHMREPIERLVSEFWFAGPGRSLLLADATGRHRRADDDDAGGAAVSGDASAARVAGAWARWMARCAATTLPRVPCPATDAGAEWSTRCFLCTEPAAWGAGEFWSAVGARCVAMRGMFCARTERRQRARTRCAESSLKKKRGGRRQ